MPPISISMRLEHSYSNYYKELESARLSLADIYSKEDMV